MSNNNDSHPVFRANLGIWYLLQNLNLLQRLRFQIYLSSYKKQRRRERPKLGSTRPQYLSVLWVWVTEWTSWLAKEKEAAPDKSQILSCFVPLHDLGMCWWEIGECGADLLMCTIFHCGWKEGGWIVTSSVVIEVEKGFRTWIFRKRPFPAQAAHCRHLQGQPMAFSHNLNDTTCKGEGKKVKTREKIGCSCHQ